MCPIPPTEAAAKAWSKSLQFRDFADKAIGSTLRHLILRQFLVGVYAALARSKSNILPATTKQRYLFLGVRHTVEIED